MGDLATLPTFQPAPTSYTHADFNNAFAALTIANSAVTTNKILDGAVTLAKIATIAAATILGNNTGAPAAPIALSAGQTRTVLGLATTDSPTFAGLTVTGTVSATNDVTVSGAGALAYRLTRGSVTALWQNGTAQTYFGTTSNHPTEILVNGGTVGTFSATGLAVTGAVSANSGSVAIPLSITSTHAAGTYMVLQNSGTTFGFLGDAANLNAGTLGNLALRSQGTAMDFGLLGNRYMQLTSAGLAVTGQGTFNDAAGTVAITSTTGTNRVASLFVNTGGTYYVGVESSAGTSFGGTAYALLRFAPSGRVIQDIINSVPITTISSTGLAVTGVSSSTGLSTHPDLLLTGADAYINMNSTTGSSGYGIRNNSGTMEFKNSGGSWLGISAGGGGGTITGTPGGTDNRLVRADGAGTAVQGSTITVDDSGNVSGIVALAMTGALSGGTTSDFSTEYRIAGTKVVGARAAAEADFALTTGGFTSDSAIHAANYASINGKMNSLLGKFRTHGLIAP